MIEEKQFLPPCLLCYNHNQIITGNWEGKITNEFGIRFWVIYILQHNQNDIKLPVVLSHQDPVCCIHTDSLPKVKDDRFILNGNGTNWDRKGTIYQQGCTLHCNTMFITLCLAIVSTTVVLVVLVTTQSLVTIAKSTLLRVVLETTQSGNIISIIMYNNIA